MISNEMWRHMYNSIFSIYLPPDDIIEKIILEKDGVKKSEFTSIIDLITFLTINSDKDIEHKDVKFFLRDNRIYEENKEFYEDLCKKLKKVV